VVARGALILRNDGTNAWLTKIIAFLVVSSISTSTAVHAEQRLAPPPETIQIPVRPLPFDLQGLLRRPEGAGRPPAVVLLPTCTNQARQLDEHWGAIISSWGYVTLTIDSFGPRGIKNCDRGNADQSDLVFDAYRGLNFLIQKRFIDPKRAAIVGFGAGAWQTLSAVERGAIEQASGSKFRAAAAFYPRCLGFKGIVTVPTLILIGERDDLAGADACRKMAAGEDDIGISRQKGEGAPVRLITYPEKTYSGFDIPVLKTPTRHLGHRREFNQSAADQSSTALREFLDSTVGAAGHP
jgi:dienelactone hydrolase